MKVCAVQPYYSMDEKDLDKCFEGLAGLCGQCDGSMDLIVLPEYCDIPASVKGAEAFHASIARFNQRARELAVSTARRCHAVVFANFADIGENGPVNTTFAFDRDGREVGKYPKAHPAPSEVKTPAQGGNGMDCSYSYSFSEPVMLEIEGVRYAFMTCYDFYMYENFPQIARYKPDIIIGCSHQRTDTHRALELFGGFLCYNTNAYLVRSAVTLGEDSPVCGCSMIVSPDGEMIVDMKNRVGLAVAEIDPAKKYLKPAGFGGRKTSHPEYIEEGRRPWLYRPAGSMTVLPDKLMPYPRICAHRGFSAVAPENSLPAFGSAVALGADEIEFDLWTTSDGVLVSLHDSTLDRVSNGSGKVWEKTFEELKGLDFGVTVPGYEGLGIVTFEDILKKFARTVVMNIHVKIWDEPGMDHKYKEIADLITKYDCRDHVYMMSSTDDSLRAFREIAPDIAICVGWDGNKDVLSMPRRAVALGAEKIQLFKPYFDQSSVDAAHRAGILCNVFWSDDPKEAKRYIDMGIDTILTNDYLKVANAVRAHVAEKRDR